METRSVSEGFGAPTLVTSIPVAPTPVITHSHFSTLRVTTRPTLTLWTASDFPTLSPLLPTLSPLLPTPFYSLLPTPYSLLSTPYSLLPMNVQRMLQAALSARRRAYAPYSRYLVGAALLSGCGRVFAGCNVENASFVQ